MVKVPSYLDDPLSYVLEALDSVVGEETTPPNHQRIYPTES